MDQFSIVIPIYNEEQNILILYKEISESLKQFNEYEIIFVNDCSIDSSEKEIDKLLINKNVAKYSNTKNMGQSYSIKFGISKSNYDTIVTMDGDCQNDPKDIHKLLSIYFTDNDIKLVGGIRNKRRDNFIKIISSKIANYIRSRILKDNCSDTGCSLKVFSRKIFNSFNYFDGMHRFLPALFSGHGYKTKFVNVNHRKRIKGYSKYGTFDRLTKGIIDLIKVKRMLNKIND